MKRKSTDTAGKQVGKSTASPKENSKQWAGTTAVVAAVIAAVAAIIAATVLYLWSSKKSEPPQENAITAKSDTAPIKDKADNPSKPQEAASPQEAAGTDTENQFQIDPNPVEPKETKASRGGYVLIAVPGGKYPMGANSEFEAHMVTIKNFYLGKYEVTNEEYARFLKENPDVKQPTYWTDENYKRPKQPVVGISFDDAKKYCDWAGLRLPTEAEWEWAARAGTSTFFSSGNFEADLDKVAWFGGSTDGFPAAVGAKEPNSFGLYDMHGNAWEWVEDDYHADYKGAPADGSAWVDEPRAQKRVIRGGSFIYSSNNCRSAYRGVWDFNATDYSTGFRAAESID